MHIPNKAKSRALSLVNSMIGLLRLPVRLFSKKKSIADQAPGKILLIRPDHIGDVIMTAPAISALKTRFPDARLLLLCESAGKQLFEGDPRIDEIFVFNWPWPYQAKNNTFTAAKLKELWRLVGRLRAERVDIAIDFRGDLRFVFLFGVLTGARIRAGNSRMGTSLLHFSSDYDVSKHEVERSLDVIRCFTGPLPEMRQQLTLSPGETTAGKELFERETGLPFPAKIAVIAPYSSKNIKSWPRGYFTEVIAHLLSRNFTVIVAGTAVDRADAAEMIRSLPGNVFSFAGRTTLRELAALVSLSSIVVGIDTGVLHLVACFDVPVVAIFGPTRSTEFRPWSPFAVVAETNTCVCNQFLHLRCDCPVNGYARCLNDLQPAEVIRVVDSIIDRSLV